jgi:uncharacterized tellurite resistance protein B-like protein
MLERIKRFFGKVTEGVIQDSQGKTAHDVRVAVCALFLEMAQIDETFSPAEMDTILSILKEKYGLSPEDAEDLMAEAQKELDNSVDLWQFSYLINENYSEAEKQEIIETLWRIVFIDGKMDQYEHYLMRKLRALLRISHDRLIAAKLKVLEST